MKHAHYKLIDGTIEIDGVRMHQTARKTPLQAAREMSALLRLRGGERVLDVCTGLGYTAIEEAKQGALVTTIEVDENVVALARKNKDSKELFANKNIELRMGDAFDVVSTMEDESFDAVMHDPPRFSFAGELYSGEFYRQLYRILKVGGRLFHYTGKPMEKRGIQFTKGVRARLREAGFARVEWHEGCLGFSAAKERVYSSKRPEFYIRNR